MTSKTKYSQHLDILIFLNYVTKANKLNFIPIPIESEIIEDSNKPLSIGKIFEKTYKESKNIHIASLEVKKATETLFQGKISVPYYMIAEKSDFARFIDASGGIRLEVDEPITRKLGPGIFEVLISTGRHTLNGRNAIDFILFKSGFKDSYSVLKSKVFLTAYLTRISNPAFFFSLPKLISIISTKFVSNVSKADMIFGLFEFKNLKLSKISTYQLPGEFKKGFFEPNKENITGLLNKLFPANNLSSFDGPKARIEIWNASGKSNLAEKLTWILRKKGYDVVEWGNFSVLQKKTLIKNLSGDSKIAQDIAEVMRCGEIVTRYDAKRYVDISLILGEDCIIE